MRAIVTGMIATYPVGGVAWDYGQYAVGLERLGWDVYYLEDTGWEAYNPTVRRYGSDWSYGAGFLQESLGALSPSLATKWHIRAMDGTCHGIDRQHFAKIALDSDLFLNVSGGTLLRDEYMACRCKVLIDSDPGWNHFVNFPQWDGAPGWQGSHGYRAHDHFFTYAERIGKCGCSLPTLGIAWQPTRPLVLMDRWNAQAPGRGWTTVLTWNNFRRPIEHQGRRYGTKEMEFPKVERLPERLSGVALEIAAGGSDPPMNRWRELGWQVTDSQSVSDSLEAYQRYIEGSRGEFSVAKNVYVATRSGWFSCRTVCYLAAGRPAVVQDTGFSEFLPAGEGLLGFNDVGQAAEAIRAVEGDYDRHSRVAREVAREYFDSGVVLGDLLQRTGLR